MSHPRGLKRAFGVKQEPVDPGSVPVRTTRREGSAEPIAGVSTHAVSPDAPRRSIAPKRYEQMQQEKARGQW